MGEVEVAHTLPTLHPPMAILSRCAVIIQFKSVPMHQLSWIALQELKVLHFSFQFTDSVTSVKKVNKTDAMTLLSTFGVSECNSQNMC